MVEVFWDILFGSFMKNAGRFRVNEVWDDILGTFEILWYKCLKFRTLFEFSGVYLSSFCTILCSIYLAQCALFHIR